MRHPVLADRRHRRPATVGHAGQVRWLPAPPPRRRTAAATALLGVAVLMAGLAGLAVSLGLTLGAPVPRVAVPLPAAAVAPVVNPPLRATGLRIPALGLDTELTEIGVDEVTGELQPPPDPAVAGWFDESAAPGEPGPSVIAGHVDSRAGPGVFYSIGGLDVGAEIEVRRSDGATAMFRVGEVFVVPKNEFPTERVYGPVPGPELRLITCGGEFDRSARRYLRNVVVTAIRVDGA